MSTTKTTFIIWLQSLNVDISMAELKRLCSEYIDRLTVNDTEAEEIAKRTAGQSMDVSG